MKYLSIGILFVLGILTATASATAQTAPPIDAGLPLVTDTSAPVAQAPVLHDPVADPISAVSDLRQAKRQGWAALSFAILVMLTRCGGRLSAKHKSLAFLGKGNAHIALAATAAFALAGYNALALGGSLYAALYAAGGVLLYTIMPQPKVTPA